MTPRHPASPESCAPCAAAPVVGRVNLPIAGTVNAKTSFGGVTRAQLVKSSAPAAEACSLLRQAMDQAAFRGEAVTSVGITGPGEPLASAEATIAALEALHAAEPGLELSLRTNGLGLTELAPRLAAAGLKRVFLDMDAVDPDVVQKLYAWIRPGAKTLPKTQAASALVAEQAAALKACKEVGLAVTVRATVYPGVNDLHVDALANRAAELGADELQLTGWTPPAPDEDQDASMDAVLDLPEAPPAADEALMASLRAAVSRILPLREGADLEAAPSLGLCLGVAPKAKGLQGLPKPSTERPNVAVATSNGFEVDMHLGQTKQFLIYGAPDGLASLIEVRNAPSAGTGDARWKALAATLCDCSYLLAAHAGANPEKVLGEEGLKLVRTEGDIEAVVDFLYGGGKKKKCRK